VDPALEVAVHAPAVRAGPPALEDLEAAEAVAAAEEEGAVKRRSACMIERKN
jgi:hypothetical protein